MYLKFLYNIAIKMNQMIKFKNYIRQKLILQFNHDLDWLLILNTFAPIWYFFIGKDISRSISYTYSLKCFIFFWWANQNTVHACEVNQTFWALEGICFHRQYLVPLFSFQGGHARAYGILIGHVIKKTII